MNRRQLLVGSAAGLAAGALARIAPAATNPVRTFGGRRGYPIFPYTFHSEEINAYFESALGMPAGWVERMLARPLSWYTLDRVLKSGVSPNTNIFWPLRVVWNMVQAAKKEIKESSIVCLQGMAASQAFGFRDVVGFLEEIEMVWASGTTRPHSHDDADVVCLMRWIKPHHPAFDQIACIERRWSLSGVCSTHRDGVGEVMDDFRITSLICGERV